MLRSEESTTDRYERLWSAVLNYKNSVELIPILGGKIILPDDVQFLLEELNRLAIENAELKERLL